MTSTLPRGASLAGGSESRALAGSSRSGLMTVNPNSSGSSSTMRTFAPCLRQCAPKRIEPAASASRTLASSRLGVNGLVKTKVPSSSEASQRADRPR